MNRVNCSQCGRWDCKPIITTPDYELQIKEKYTISQCLNCGNIYTAVRPNMTTLFTKHYPENYRCYDRKTQLFGINIAQMRINGQATQRAAIVNKYLSKKTGQRILEVGCATGEFLKLGKQKFGWTVCGIEPNKKLCQEIARDGIQTVNTIMEKADVPKNYYHAVCLFNVFEHLWDSAYSLRRINSFLSPNGLVVIEIPDFNAIARRLFGKYWFLYHLPRHLSHFTQASLDLLMTTTGFKKVVILKQFRPTVNATSFKYYLQEKISNPLLRKFISENNPILLVIGILLELTFNLIGHPNHIIAIYKKIKSVPAYKSRLKIKKI